jgi:hypothetical protein
MSKIKIMFMETYNLNDKIQQPRSEWFSYYTNKWIDNVYQDGHRNTILEEGDQLLHQGRDD